MSRDSFQYPLEGNKCLGGITDVWAQSSFQFLVFHYSFTGARH